MGNRKNIGEFLRTTEGEINYLTGLTEKYRPLWENRSKKDMFGDKFTHSRWGIIFLSGGGGPFLCKNRSKLRYCGTV